MNRSISNSETFTNLLSASLFCMFTSLLSIIFVIDSETSGKDCTNYCRRVFLSGKRIYFFRTQQMMCRKRKENLLEIARYACTYAALLPFSRAFLLLPFLFFKKILHRLITPPPFFHILNVHT
jgi:hypothetical protein